MTAATSAGIGRGRASRAPATTPLRAPDVRDTRLMTRRAAWLTAMHLLIPGSAQVLAGSRRLGRLALGLWLTGWALLGLAAVLWVVLPQALLTLPTNALGLTVVQVALAVLAVLWAVLTFDTFRLLRLVRVGAVVRPVLAALLAAALLVGVGGAAWGAWAAGVARATVADVFPGGRYALPAGGRYNVLLLGGDAGAGRSGLRPDSISVMSFDALTGETVTFGLPRDQNPVPFAEGSPMRERYPAGYGADGVCNVDVCQLNSIYTEVELKEADRYPDAAANGSSPGIEATREAVEGALGIDIQYFVLVDMGSFDELIDAMGGVTIDVKQRIPVGKADTEVFIEPGRRHLNGNRALWYARSRYGDAEGDYGRMKRQRELQRAMLRQLDPGTLLTRFERIADAGEATVRTDIPQGLAGGFAGLMVRSRSQPVTNVEFVPPDYAPAAPDYARIRAAVAKALE